MVFKQGNPNKLLIVGDTGAPSGTIYEIELTRDAAGFESGYAGTAAVLATAPSADGGLGYGPGGVLMYTTWPSNTLCQILPGSGAANRVIDLTVLGVGASTGGLAVTPNVFAGASKLRLTSYDQSEWYSADLVPDGMGTFDVANLALRSAVTNGQGGPAWPESILYVAANQPGFLTDSVLVCNWNWDSVGAYGIDAAGDLDPSLRRDFLLSYQCAGSAVDPLTGAFLFPAYSGSSVLVVKPVAAGVGTTYCSPAVANSTGSPASISGSGSAVVSSNDLMLTSTGLPQNSAAFFLCSRAQGFGMHPGGSAGNICLGNPIGRVVGGVIANSGATGVVNVTADLNAMPQPSGAAIVIPGDTWNFQCWYRDAAVGGGSTSNFSDGLEVLFTWSPTLVPGMVPIPAGMFMMGSIAAAGLPYYGDSSTQPVRQVTISTPFWMGQYEVTQAEYQALMGSNPSIFQGASLPVENLSWHQARAYCAALTTQQAGNIPPGFEYRLPTEAEWEYACRAGTTTEFNYGPDLYCNQARFNYSSHSNPPASCGNPLGAAPVGSYAPNAFGLYDVHGNVWEWCLDSYGAYGSAPVTDPFVTGGSSRVARGGSWEFASASSRSARRVDYDPGDQHLDVGFRVVLAPVLVPVTLVPGMVPIPAGTFMMGSNAPNSAPYFNTTDQQPVHQVTISTPFWMGQHEVTQADYQALMGSNPSFYPGATRPVERVSWHDARAYCAALTAQRAGNIPAGFEYRLPTEAEWEYACRAGTTTEFHYGPDLFCNQARFWYSNHSNSSCGLTTSSGTVPVGSYAPNAFGLYDMHGNVYEWCLDSFAAYNSAAVTNPFVTGGPYRVIRGGGWGDNSGYCRSANRSYGGPGDSYRYLGFRVVLAQVLVP